MSKGAYLHGPLILIGTALAACVILAGVFAFVLRDQMLVHYHAAQYVSADEASPATAQWLHERPLLTLPVMLPHLKSTDPEVTRRCGEFVRQVLDEHNDPTDPSDAHVLLLVAAMLDEQYPTYSVNGCAIAIDLAMQILEGQLNDWSPAVATALGTAGGVVRNGLTDTNPAIRQHTLERLNAVWSWDGVDDVAWSLVREWRREMYMIAAHQLGDRSIDVRKAAIAAIVEAPFHEGDSAIIEMLRHEDPSLRRAALLGLARACSDDREISAADSLTATQKEALIDFLHDEDETVQQAAHHLLRRSRVSEGAIHLAKLMTHPLATERAKVPALALNLPDINPVAWVLKLANDESPAVRLAAARAASTSKDVDLQAKLAQMASSDPDPLVRNMCQQLLSSQAANAPPLQKL